MKYIFLIPLLAFSLSGYCQNKKPERKSMKKTTAATFSDGAMIIAAVKER
ncbi:MAG: hypothetical protein P0Y49_12195 [Candidatus Pedobacter colombiensis]|uniref:Uncharacterized protein n=1 Tax=Candidatus Pedobacter colombiensis TaxID=3121371 RepID=A0AAJ5W3N4_9SPHI|nr:hypothetical protein [Pedobacter sp.]WEK17556.1 MAG: hypothetical protein P0Y49_12195 [Pedobacter sp.]